jgi:hypothetical protein
MAKKKTSRKVLSDRALELVMLNVLGGLVNTMSDDSQANDCRDDDGERRDGPDPTEHEVEQADLKLNS